MLRRLFKNRPPNEPPDGQAPGDPPAADPGPVDPPAAEPAPGSASAEDDPLALAPAEAAARIAATDDVDTLVALALRAKGELRERVLAHPRLALAASLTALEKRSRHKDKSVNRHARRLLDRRRSLQHEADAGRQRAEELAAALQRRDSTTDERAWRERQHELHRRLEDTLNDYAEVRGALAAFGDPAPDLEPLRVDAASLPPLDPAPATDRAAGQAPDAAAAPVAEPFEPLVQAFQALDAAMRAAEPFEDLAARRQALTERWLTAADHRPPEPAQHRVFEAVSHRFHELADAVQRLTAAPPPTLPPQPLTLPAADAVPPRALWEDVAARRRLARDLDRRLSRVRWPDWAGVPPELQRLQDTAASLGTELARADQRLSEELERLEAQLETLRGAIDHGGLADAQRLLSQARTHHDALPADAVRQAGRELGRQAARLAELKDWQTFATTPKRESLVQAMAALAATPLAPRDQADRIKQLRREWQALGPVTQAVDGRLADHFNAEAERAFEPCRAYFAELAEQRKANLAERQRLCDQLEHYLADTDWRSADMKAAERIMRAARDEWRRYHPVERNPGKAVEARFERLQDQLHDYVKAEWERNLRAKEALVAEADALVEADQSVAGKVAAAKSLQQRWRDVGITPRRPDQRLWRQFRAACDRIFAARDDARHAEDAAIEALGARLQTELDAFAARLDQLTGGAAPEDASSIELRDFRHRLRELERLPAARRKPLIEQRQRLLARYAELLADRQRAAARQRLAAAASWDAAAAAAEAAGQELPAAEPADAVAAEAIRERRATAGGPVPADALLRLTVKAELAAGRPSPERDQALRMELQVERLQAGLSGGAATESAADLADAWCRLGPKDAATAPLRERFFAALQTMEAAAPG